MVSVPIKDDIDPLAIVLVRKQAVPLSNLIAKFSLFCDDYFKMKHKNDNRCADREIETE